MQIFRNPIKQFIHAVPRRLASPRAGLILIILTFGFTLGATFFPGQIAAGFVRSIGQTLALEDISSVSALSFQERFDSPLFILLIAALSLSLCFSLYFRIKSEFKRSRAEAAAPLRDAGAQDRSGAGGAAVAKVEQELRRRGYRTRAARAAGSWQIHAGKGGSGIWGSVLFHVGILLVFAAVVLTASASFKASVKLIEWQPFDARVDRYGTQSAGRWYTPPAQPLTFRLIRVEPDYETDGAETTASIVEPTLEGKISRFTEQAPVYISHGLRHAGVTIHQGKETGFAPQVTIENAAGKRVFDGYTRLATLSGPEKESYVDYVDIADKDKPGNGKPDRDKPDRDKKLRAEFELFPDAVFRDGAYLSKSGAPKNPVLHVVLREQDKVVFDEFIPITRDFSAGGYTVFFGKVRRWSQLDVVDAPGVPVLMAATLFGSLGLLLRLLRVRRRIVVTLSGVSLPGVSLSGADQEHGTDQERGARFDLAGSSEKFPHTFEEELASIRAALAQRLAVGHNGEPASQPS